MSEPTTVDEGNAAIISNREGYIKDLIPETKEAL